MLSTKNQMCQSKTNFKGKKRNIKTVWIQNIAIDLEKNCDIQNVQFLSVSVELLISGIIKHYNWSKYWKGEGMKSQISLAPWIYR